MKNSHIEWTDHTFNPWEGCTKVSPGCAHCYAEARNRRFAAGANWGPGAPRRRTSAANWKQPLKWNEGWRDIDTTAALDGGEARRPRVFCASLADWLDHEVPVEWLADLLELIHSTPNLDWLLLTKRPQNWRHRICAAGDWMLTHGKTNLYYAIVNPWVQAVPTPPANVWIGTTVEDQQRADERIPALLEIPARVRFLSCEPLLASVDVSDWLGEVLPSIHCQDNFVRTGIEWVIVGGESGAGARPMHPDWARSLRGQCEDAGVPFFFKQWGEWSPIYQTGKPDIMVHHDTGRAFTNDQAGAQKAAGLQSFYAMSRVGKLAAGRLLDGKEHSEFPHSQPSALPASVSQSENRGQAPGRQQPATVSSQSSAP